MAQDTNETNELTPERAERQRLIREEMQRETEKRRQAEAAIPLGPVRNLQTLKQEKAAEQAEREAAQQEALGYMREASMERATRAVYFTDLTPIETKEALVSFIREYIQHCYKTEKRGVRIYELNRKFGIKAKHLGSSITGLLPKLVDGGHVGLELYMGVAVLYDVEGYYLDRWNTPEPKQHEHKIEMFERSMNAAPRSRRTGTARR